MSTNALPSAAPPPEPRDTRIVALKRFEGFTAHAVMAEAVAWLQARGFSVGSMERELPRAVMFGDVAIGKWSTLTPAERRALHGRLFWRLHDDRLALAELYATAPHAAAAAFVAEA